MTLGVVLFCGAKTRQHSPRTAKLGGISSTRLITLLAAAVSSKECDASYHKHR